MRRFIVTTIILCFGMIVMAQDYTKTEQGALHVEPVFEGKIVKDVNSTILTGKAIEKYNLTKMHTLKLTANEEQRNKIEEESLSHTFLQPAKHAPCRPLSAIGESELRTSDAE